MIFFDFLVKTALFWAFLLFFGDLRHKLRPIMVLGAEKIIAAELDFRLQFVTQITEEKQKGPKKGCFD